MDISTEMLSLGLAWFVVFVFSTTLHEAAHSWAALQLGDPTAYYSGQVTLNPLPHIQREPVGMVLIPIVSFFLNGWMIGWASAPFDPSWAARHPRRAAWMALAGPAANLLLVLTSGLIIRVGMMMGYFEPPERIGNISAITVAANGGIASAVATLVSILFILNLILFLFNLLPLPPLDGSGALPLLLSPQATRRYQEIMYQPTSSLFGLIIAWIVFARLFQPVFSIALKVLYPEVTYI